MKIHSFSCASLVVAIGLFVMTSWHVDYSIGTRIVPGEVTMKFSTALCFVLSGLSWSSFSMKWRTSATDTMGIMFAFAQMGIMLGLCFSQLTGTPSPLLLFAESDDAVKTVVAGMPSLCTMSSFMFVSFASIAWVSKRYKVSRILGSLIALCGGIALLGYAANFGASLVGCSGDASFLYCYLSGDASSAMAIHTATAFILLGACIIWSSSYTDGVE